MNYYLKFHFKNRDLTSGFTLLELLVASAMTLIIVTLAGIAIANITRGNLKSNIDSQVQYDLNRTIEFITREIQQSYEVSNAPDTDINTSGMPTAIKNAIPSSDVKYILLLRNNSLNSSSRIVYFTVPGTSTYVTQNWLLAKGQSNLVLYRWGPSFNSDGNYNSTDPSAWGDPVPIADMLSPDSNTSTCASASLIPSSGSKKGFYLCVSSNKKQVTINATAKIQSDRLTQNKVGSNGDVVSYDLKTEVYARSAAP